MDYNKGAGEKNLPASLCWDADRESNVNREVSIV